MTITDLQNEVNSMKDMLNQRASPSNFKMPPLTSSNSAINNWDRVRYGFADDSGKRTILQQAGYSQDQIVTLPNGEYGVKSDFMGLPVIKPVDPKGFMSKDLVGDIGESVGKMLTIGGAVGGSLLGPAGAAGGAAGGEVARQGIGTAMGIRDPKNFATLMNTDSQGHSHLGGAGEILAEAALAGFGQAAAETIGAKLAQSGAKGASLELRPTVNEKLSTFVGVPSKVGQKIFSSDVPIVDAEVGERLLARSGVAIQEMIDNSQPVASKLYSQGLKKLGLSEESQLFNAQELKNALYETRWQMVDKNKGGIYNAEVQTIQNIMDNLKSVKNLSLNDLQTYSRSLRDMAESAMGPRGQGTTISHLLNQASSAVSAIKNSPIQVAGKTINLAKLNSSYSAIKNAQETLLDLGRTTVGAEDLRLPISMKLLRYGKQMESPNLQAMEDAIKTLQKVGVKSDTSINPIQDMYAGLASKFINKAQKSGFGAATSSPAYAARRAAVNILTSGGNINKARLLVGIAKANPAILDEPVGKIFPTVQALNKILANAKASGPLQSAALNTLKGVSAPLRVGNMLKSSSGKQIGIQMGTRSLNSILYGRGNQ